jgi:hypothetical protein
VYGNDSEIIPPDQLVQQGKLMCTTTYQDASPYDHLITGRAVSGVIQFVNRTPRSSFCKKKQTVETATYGPELMVTRQADHQIIYLRYTSCMMGIPLNGPSLMFGDSKSVITSSTIPLTTLNKRHNAMSYSLPNPYFWLPEPN